MAGNLAFESVPFGWVRGATRIDSPNFDARPRVATKSSPQSAPIPVELLVIHYISLPAGRFSGDAVLRLFTNQLAGDSDPQLRALADTRVSAHFFIRRRGELLQFVSTEDRAWHAGVSKLFAREKCNDYSIGVELEGDSQHVFTQAQYRRLTQLSLLLCARYPLRFAAGHSDIAPGRKEDPGPKFEWSRYLETLGSTRLSRPF